jgi:hypothetical protein
LQLGIGDAEAVRDYGGMEDTPVAKRFDKLCNVFFPIAEIGAMSEESFNALSEQLRNLKIQPCSNSSSENNNEHLGTQEGGLTYIGETSKIILSPIAVRCAGHPPSLRKESKVDKLKFYLFVLLKSSTFFKKLYLF